MVSSSSRPGRDGHPTALPIGDAGRSRRPGWPWAVGIAVAAVSLPLAALAAGHALTVPWADDWAYERMAYSLERTGGIHLIGWNDVTLVGHLVWGAPWIAVLGPGLQSVHWAGAAAAIAGLLGAFALFRQFVPLQAALLGVAALGVTPFYMLLAGTFMTDVPAFAADMWCLALGVRWLRASHPRWMLLAGSLAVGAYGFTIRESAICAPIAVLVGTFLAAESKKQRLRLLASAAAFALAIVVFYRWREGLQAPAFGRTPQLIVRHDIVFLCQALMVVALIAFPAAVALLVQAPRRLPARAVVVGVAASVAAALVPLSQARYYGHTDSIFVGNLVTQKGALGDTVLSGLRPDLFPGGAWIALEVLAVLSGCMVAAVSVRATATSFRQQPGGIIVVLYMLVSLVAVTGRVDTNAPVYDRYLLGVGAVAILAVLSATPWAAARVSGSFAAGALALALPALLSVALLQDSIAYNHARWQAGQQAVRAGTPADAVDAGFEWAGYHDPGMIGEPRPAAPDTMEPGLRGLAGTYTVAFGRRPCVVVSDSPKAGLPLRRIS